MRKIEVTVETIYTVFVDDNNEIVCEYETDKELIGDCVGYFFNPTLPVIKDGGVKLYDTDILDISIDEVKK